MFLVASMLRLHLENEMATLSVSIRWMEHTCVGIEATASLVPLPAVELIEIVTPVEPKLVMLRIVGEHLDVVVEHEPGHVNWVETCAP